MPSMPRVVQAAHGPRIRTGASARAATGPDTDFTATSVKGTVKHDKATTVIASPASDPV
jgi:hypothetical protein